MKVKVFLKLTPGGEAEVLEYNANHARTSFEYDDCIGRNQYTNICIVTLTLTPEFSMFGRKKRDWKSWDYKSVALIKTDLIDRIEITE